MDTNAVNQVLDETLGPTLNSIQNSADTLNNNVREGIKRAQEITQRLDSFLPFCTHEQSSTNDDGAMSQASGNRDSVEQEPGNDNVHDEEAPNENSNTTAERTALTKRLRGAATHLIDWYYEAPTEGEKLRMVSLAEAVNIAAKALGVDLREAQGYLDMIKTSAAEDGDFQAWKIEHQRDFWEKQRVEEEEKVKAMERRERDEEKAREKAAKKARKKAEQRKRRKERREAEKKAAVEDEKAAV